MYIAKKRSAKQAAAWICAFVFLGTVLLTALSVFAVRRFEAEAADAENSASKGYYYDNLTFYNGEYELGKKFYDVLDEMRVSGDFKDGKISRSLDGIVSSDLIEAWVEDGDITVPKAFGAARDSFLMDHPELFYIDVYKIMISAGYSSGKYTGYIDSGREPNIYRDNAFSSEAEVNKAIAAYDAAVKKFADAAVAKADAVSSLYKDDAKKAIAANNEIATAVKYDYSAYEDYMENGEDAASVTSLAYTAYGALVGKKAVCAGYSFGYKAVMDYLGIETVVVSGYSTGKDTSGENTAGNVPHSWNYVKLEIGDKTDSADSAVRTVAARAEEKKYDWFAFDTTWNGVTSDKTKYCAMDATKASEEHMPDAVISSSKYPLDYPSLSQMPYAQAADPDSVNIEIEKEGFACNKICSPSGDSYTVYDYVNYHGKNASDLLATENLRLAQRYFYMDKDGNKVWSKWQDLANTVKYHSEGHTGLGIYNQNNSTVAVIPYNVQSVQYAVIDGREPDESVDFGGYTFKIYYSDEALVAADAVLITDEIENPVYGTYTPPPYIIASRSKPISGTDVSISSSMSEPGNSSIMADSKAINVKLVYDEPLRLLDSSKDAEIVVTANNESALDYSSLVKYPDGKYVHLSKDENGVLNTVEFKFKPSLMFEHNRVGYKFHIVNVGSAKIVEKKNENGELVRTTSDRVPNSAYYVFSRIIIACPKVFGDGRLYLECCAQPTLADNSDLSATGFLDEDGNSTFSESARSQMMLVVNEVPSSTENAVLNEIDASDNGISKSDIKKSQTYDIGLQICGKIAKIPDGSFVRLMLGFPEGYGPDDAGVSFKIFHRKHKGGDAYEIEELPCVVTKFGLVITTTSFSPYTVTVLDADKVTDKTITASVDGKGGTLSSDDGRVRALKEGESYTYTLTPQDGYSIYKVLLNGKDVTAAVTESDSFTVNYGDLERNNELEIKYISADAKARYEANNIVEPAKIVVPVGADLFGKDTSFEGDITVPSSNVGLIVGLVLLFAVLAAAAAVAIIFIYRRKTLAVQTANGASPKKTTRPATQSAAPKNTARMNAQSAPKPAQPTQTAARPAARPTAPTQTAARPTAPTQTATRPAARPTVQPKNNDKK